MSLENSVDQDQTASQKQSDPDLHCLIHSSLPKQKFRKSYHCQLENERRRISGTYVLLNVISTLSFGNTFSLNYTSHQNLNVVLNLW